MHEITNSEESQLDNNLPGRCRPGYSTPAKFPVYILGTALDDMPNIPVDPVRKAAITRQELREMEQNLQHALDDAIARGVLTTPLNAVFS